MAQHDDKIWGSEKIGISECATCEKCKDCIYQHPDLEHQSDFDYQKIVCMVYSADKDIMKPDSVLYDGGDCDYFESMTEFLKNNPD